MSTSVWMSLARGDRVAHAPEDIDPPTIPRRLRLTGEMFERFGLTAQCLGCRSIRKGIGYPASHTERCRERLSKSLRRSLKLLPRSRQRELSEPGVRREPGT